MTSQSIAAQRDERNIVETLPPRRLADVIAGNWLTESLAWVIFAAAFANCLAYVVAFSNPVIVHDAWYFLEVFISKGINGTLHFSDFLLKRPEFDHAQPLGKLILLLELRHFHLDFRVEAIIGLFCAVGSLLLLRRIVMWNGSPGYQLRSWIWAAMCVVLISLNSTAVWVWPLVASSFTIFVLLFLLLAALWRYLDTGKLALLTFATLAFDFASDDTAIIATIACILGLALLAWRTPLLRRRAFHAVGIIVICLIVVRVGYALAYSVPVSETISVTQRLSLLASVFVHDGWWQWPLIPLGSSVGYIEPLQHLFGDRGRAVQIGTGALLLILHLWFWRRAFINQANAATLSAIVLMLFFYGLLAGIIYARAATFGNDYLDQPRYVLIYSFGNVSLLLMCAGSDWLADKNRRFSRGMVVLLTTALILWQLPLTLAAWRAGPYIALYEQKLARQIWYMSETGNLPDKCLPELAVCDSPPEKRKELIQLLKTNNLNVFSPEFQLDNKIYPPGYFDQK